MSYVPSGGSLTEDCVDSNHMDGVVGVTQREISSGQNFTYFFTVASDQSGTFWYVCRNLPALYQFIFVYGESPS